MIPLHKLAVVEEADEILDALYPNPAEWPKGCKLTNITPATTSHRLSAESSITTQGPGPGLGQQHGPWTATSSGLSMAYRAGTSDR